MSHGCMGDRAWPVEDLGESPIGMDLYAQIVDRDMVGRECEGILHGRLNLHKPAIIRGGIVVFLNTFQERQSVRLRHEDLPEVSDQAPI